MIEWLKDEHFVYLGARVYEYPRLASGDYAPEEPLFQPQDGLGVLRDPVRNIWVVEFGMIACVMLIPLALIAGQVREIPFGWRLIDCSFGGFGIVPLAICRREIKRLAANRTEAARAEALAGQARALP